MEITSTTSPKRSLSFSLKHGDELNVPWINRQSMPMGL